MAEEKGSQRQSGLWGAVAFGVALAVIIGVRLEQAALAVVVGVACGVGASIPISLLIVSVLRRWDARVEKPEIRNAEQRRAQSAPIVMVAPPNAPQLTQPATWSGPLPVERRFAIIGEEKTEELFDN